MKLKIDKTLIDALVEIDTDTERERDSGKFK